MLEGYDISYAYLTQERAFRKELFKTMPGCVIYTDEDKSITKFNITWRGHTESFDVRDLYSVRGQAVKIIKACFDEYFNINTNEKKSSLEGSKITKIIFDEWVNASIKHHKEEKNKNNKDEEENIIKHGINEGLDIVSKIVFYDDWVWVYKGSEHVSMFVKPIAFRKDYLLRQISTSAIGSVVRQAFDLRDKKG